MPAMSAGPQPGQQLVEEEEPGPLGQRPGQLQAPHGRHRQLGDPGVGPVGQADPVQDGVAPGSGGGPAPFRLGSVEGAGRHVVRHREAPERLADLEGAGDPGPGEGPRPGAGEVAPVDEEPPGRRPLAARHQVESVVLPAPLGPMRPSTVPGSSVSETPSTAFRPPKRRMSAVGLQQRGSHPVPPDGVEQPEAPFPPRLATACSPALPA